MPTTGAILSLVHNMYDAGAARVTEKSILFTSQIIFLMLNFRQSEWLDALVMQHWNRN